MDLTWQLIRYALIAAGTSLASKGYIGADQVETLAGALLAILTAGWGIYVKAGTKAVPAQVAAQPSIPTVSAATGAIERSDAN